MYYLQDLPEILFVVGFSLSQAWQYVAFLTLKVFCSIFFTVTAIFQWACRAWASKTQLLPLRVNLEPLKPPEGGALFVLLVIAFFRTHMVLNSYSRPVGFWCHQWQRASPPFAWVCAIGWFPLAWFTGLSYTSYIYSYTKYIESSLVLVSSRIFEIMYVFNKKDSDAHNDMDYTTCSSGSPLHIVEGFKKFCFSQKK